MDFLGLDTGQIALRRAGSGFLSLVSVGAKDKDALSRARARVAGGTEPHVGSPQAHCSTLGDHLLFLTLDGNQMAWYE